MRVFISWSGGRSRSIAEVLRRWFPSVLQVVRPYFSPDDVAKGSRWSSEIAKELEGSRIGLLILTPENQDAPWLLFEAGALAKNLDRSKVCPILFGGLEPTDVKGPLVQFQAARFQHDDMKRVVKMMNAELGEAALAADVLDSVFEMWWPRLSEEVNAELKQRVPQPDEASRTERDMLEEVLSLARTMSRDGRMRRLDMDHPVYDDLTTGCMNLFRTLSAKPIDDETREALRRIVRPLDYLGRHLHGPRSSREFGLFLREFDELFLKEAKPRIAQAASDDESS
jgi:hypothetical protein